MGREPDIPLRKVAEVAVDYFTSGDGMRKVADRHEVSDSTVSRAVQVVRTMPLEARRFELQKHVADVLVESAELELMVYAAMRQQLGDQEFVKRQSGRDFAAMAGSLSKERRGWFDYMRRTFGDRLNEPPADSDGSADGEQYEQ